MTYTDKQIDALAAEVRSRLSEKRYAHTLGVAEAAMRIAEQCLPDELDRIRVAALLHDITKEYSTHEQMRLLYESGEAFSDSDLIAEPVHHSLTAPLVIKRDFPCFADPDVLSAVYNHTLGAPDMSLFDEIIFVADYVEAGRSYESCVSVREELFSSLAEARDRDESIGCLHRATLVALERTIESLLRSGRFIHERAVETRNAYLGRMPKVIK